MELSEESLAAPGSKPSSNVCRDGLTTDKHSALKLPANVEAVFSLSAWKRGGEREADISVLTQFFNVSTRTRGVLEEEEEAEEVAASVYSCTWNLCYDVKTLGNAELLQLQSVHSYIQFCLKH